MNELILKFITLLHTLFIICVVVTPFLNSTYFLLLHAIFVPFMVFHWICNNNTCVLTIVEKNLRKKMGKEYDEDDCFTCRLIEPVYDFKKNNIPYSKVIYTTTILLWFITFGKLIYKYKSGQITGFQDLFVI